MTRLTSAMKTDLTVQLRNRLYVIGVTFAVIAGIIISFIAPALRMEQIIPVVMILLVGGSTLLYVVGLITFEKEEGTLYAVIVSPLRSSEYLLSKVLTLTALATLESILIVTVVWLFPGGQAGELPSNSWLLLGGIVILGSQYTLVGIVTMVRYDRLMDALIPVLAIAIPLQLPFLYFLGWVEHPLFLLIPTSAPTVMMQGAYRALAPWEWVYAFTYASVWVIGLAYWAAAAYRTHIVMKAG